MSFELLPYSSENLLSCLLDGSQYTTDNTIRGRRHFGYFQQYFDELKACTIVVENYYVDRDYLQDYAEYYDRCFSDYPRRTRRLHFFSLDFSADEFESAVINTSDNDMPLKLSEHYLGFIVVKPLPQTIIGRTCLKTYCDDLGRRNFPCLRSYPVNLYGLELEVSSLAYQEQDQVVAACATSALWTCLQGTGKLFQHSIPAPVEITKWASDQIPDNVLAVGARAFPSNGLTARQMAHAIRRVDLEPQIIRANVKYNLDSALYAYLKGKIPSILSARLVRYTDGQQTTVGMHAVAITGYSLREDANYDYSSDDFKLRASKIDKIYVHDDQLGPFCRLEWGALPSPERIGQEEHYSGLRTSRGDSHYYIPDFILLPLYHKIRIPFSLIHDEMLALNSVMTAWRSNLRADTTSPEWDIYLTTVNEYKASIRKDYLELGVDYRDCLYARMPRFMWRVTVRRDAVIQMDFLFDATGVAQHSLLVNVFSTACEDKDILIGMAQPEYKDDIANYPLQMKAVIEAFASSSMR